MTDLHTHILPGMDDGAENTAMSIRMLKLEAEQGADCVCFTPHFYPERENVEGFLNRRERMLAHLKSRVADLPEEERKSLPRYILSAEVAWYPGLSDLPGLTDLCYAGTKYLLLELPMRPWNERIFSSLYDCMNRTGFIPVIAHIDRYFSVAGRKNLAQLYEMGLPIQMSTAAFCSFFSRRQAFRVMEHGYANYLISDCHNLTSRPPDLSPAYEVLSRHFGAEAVQAWQDDTDNLLGKVRGESF